MKNITDKHINLVKKIANSIKRKLPQHIDVEDMIQDGMVGLIKALDRYDPSQGAAFETYAGYRIKGEIQDGLRAISYECRHHYGTHETYNMSSLDTIDGPFVPKLKQNGLTLYEVIEHADLIEMLDKLISALPVIQKKTMNLRTKHNMTLDKISDVLDVSEGRICQILKAAEKKLIIKYRIAA